MKKVTEEELARRVEVERIKDSSNFLRGTMVESLKDPITGAISESDTQLSKFHGIYQQDDRDIRDERRRQKLEPHYQFMIRIRVPGGICDGKQWLEVDRLSREYANGTIRLTTRQAFQYHGILKKSLKPTISNIIRASMDTIAACGDVNRNVMCSPNPDASDIHREVQDLAQAVSDHLTPRTSAYHEIWLDGEKVDSSRKDEEPIYGKWYLPRKFKMGFAVPPGNDIDVFSQDLGFIAIEEKGKLAGFNVVVGGGMGMTHSETETYPRLGDVIGFCKPEQVVEVSEEIVKIQRDYGDRENRKHARFKYTIDDRGIDWLKKELNKRLGWKLEKLRPYAFEYTGDRYGWLKGADGKWHCTIFVENGRIRDTEDVQMLTGLREIAKVHKGDFRLTGNQNVIIGAVSTADKPKIAKLLKKYKLHDTDQQSALRLNSMACVAFPTCGLAMAESERYLPSLVTKLEAVMKKAGLENDPIVMRMTGCPNGCARPYLAEIGFVGKAPGRYNLYLGASFTGDRLNKLYRENVNEEQILETLTPLITKYAKERNANERFGDYLVRTKVIKAVKVAKTDFHG